MAINKQTLSQQIVQELKRRILEGELRSGERIWAGDIVAELDVSMAPVKDALIVLQGDGLLTNIPRHGAFIREFSQKEVRDLYDMRALFEAEAVRQGFAAGKINGQLIDELIRLNEKIGQDLKGKRFGTKEAAYHYDRQFHDVLISGCDNVLLVEWYKRLNAQSQIIRLASYNAGVRGECTYFEHKTIIDGLKSGDVNRAVDAINGHLGSIVDAIRKFVSCQSDIEQSHLKARRRA